MTASIRGDIAVSHVTVRLGDRDVLKDVSLAVKAGTKTAIIGPTAAGKTQLLYVLAGLLEPASGTVEYDGVTLVDYDKSALHRQVVLVFQDATLFNLSGMPTAVLELMKLYPQPVQRSGVEFLPIDVPTKRSL